MARLLWILTIVCAVVAVVVLVLGSQRADSAVQECAAAAYALAIAVLPYVLARAVDGLRKIERDAVDRRRGPE